MRIFITIVGVGGTGGNLVARLSKFLKYYKQADREIVVSIVDGDYVESKNTDRQPYEDEDVGDNKAVILAENIESAFGVQLMAFSEYITSKNNLESIFDTMNKGRQISTDIYVLVSAVDNHHARKCMSEWFSRYINAKNVFYIDSANEDADGEVVFAIKENHIIKCPDRFWHYKNLNDEESKPVTEMSCEELNKIKPQHYATNCFAADIIFAYLCLLIENADISERMKGGITYFNPFKMFSEFHEFYFDEEKKDYVDATYELR